MLIKFEWFIPRLKPYLICFSFKVFSDCENRLEELNKEWIELKNRSEELIQNIIPAYNKLLWNNEIGALNVK